MKPFVFSCDSHVNEPRTLWQDKLPAAMKDKAIQPRKDEKYFSVLGNGKTLMRMQVADGVSGNEKIGRAEIAPRKLDMAKDGIDAELIYPTLGLVISRLGDRDLEAESSRIYNDWCYAHFKDHLDTFVPAALLPVGDVSEAVAELKRAIAMGYQTSMLPATLPEGLTPWNSPDWDPLWELAASAEHPIVVHSGTGADTVAERGPGAALLNYMYAARGASDFVAKMVAGGSLDRFPKLTVVTAEAGASYLFQISELFDEIYPAHIHYVRPKLGRKPSEIIRDQVKAAFTHDRSAIRMRATIGHGALLFSSDYPHLEGSFPHTQRVIEEQFEGLDVPDHERADILGLTAARLFKLRNPAVNPHLCG